MDNYENVNPIKDIKTVFARSAEQRDNPILVPESMYEKAVQIAKDNNISVRIEPVKAIWKKENK